MEVDVENVGVCVDLLINLFAPSSSPPPLIYPDHGYWGMAKVILP
jgi:hypothetical protein